MKVNPNSTHSTVEQSYTTDSAGLQSNNDIEQWSNDKNNQSITSRIEYNTSSRSPPKQNPNMQQLAHVKTIYTVTPVDAVSVVSTAPFSPGAEESPFATVTAAVADGLSFRL